MHYSGTLSCVLDWDRINLENYYSLYITKQIKTERTIKPAVITNMTSVLVRPKIIVYLIQIPNCKAMITVPPSLGLGKENMKSDYCRPQCELARIGAYGTFG